MKLQKHLLTLALACTSIFALAQEKPLPPTGGRPARPNNGGRPGEIQQAMPQGIFNMADELVLVLNKIKKENPEEFKRLTELQKTNHGQFFAEIRKLLPKENQSIQEMMENERKCRQLANKIRNSQNEEEKAKLEAELKDLIVANFDATIKDATARIEKMQERIQALKENKDEILEARYQAFINAPKRRPRPNPAEGDQDDAKRPLPPPPPPMPDEAK